MTLLVFNTQDILKADKKLLKYSSYFVVSTHSPAWAKAQRPLGIRESSAKIGYISGNSNPFVVWKLMSCQMAILIGTMMKIHIKYSKYILYSYIYIYSTSIVPNSWNSMRSTFFSSLHHMFFQWPTWPPRLMALPLSRHRPATAPPRRVRSKPDDLVLIAMTTNMFSY